MRWTDAHQELSFRHQELSFRALRGIRRDRGRYRCWLCQRSCRFLAPLGMTILRGCGKGNRSAGVIAIFVLIAAIAAPQAPDSAPHLIIYSAQNSFSVALSERDGRAYVGIGDVLQPLGEMRVEDNGRKWKAKF